MRSIGFGEVEAVDCWWASAMVKRERWSCVMLAEVVRW
jgi:hypothetical protein